MQIRKVPNKFNRRFNYGLDVAIKSITWLVIRICGQFQSNGFAFGYRNNVRTAAIEMFDVETVLGIELSELLKCQ